VAKYNIKRKEQTVEANQSLTVAYIRPGLRRDDQYIDTISGKYIPYPHTHVRRMSPRYHLERYRHRTLSSRRDRPNHAGRSCLDFTRLMADLTYHHSEWVLMMSFKHTNMTVIRDHMNFRDAGKERRYHQKTSHKLRSEYERSVRYYQEHDDPAFP
jgi:hypothetical protein